MDEELLLNNNEFDIVELFDIGNRYLHNEITIPEIIANYGPDYVEIAKSYVSSFGVDFLESKINTFLSGSKDETLRALNEEGFSVLLADTSVKVASLVNQYINKGININDLLSQLGKCGIKDKSDMLITAYDIDIASLSETAARIAGESSLIIAYAGFTEAYKVMMSALEDAAIQHEHRLMVEKECEKAVSLIKEYREKMQASITKYFQKHLSAFEHGFAQMDKAIEDNDSNGYIKGNAEIQETLGYYSQFRNQKEFDELMDSKNSFKL